MSDKPVTNNSQTKFMNSEVEVFCDNSQTFSSVGTNYLLIEELVCSLGYSATSNSQEVADLMKDMLVGSPSLLSDYFTDLIEEEEPFTKGKKGDRVYNAPKAFYNRSK